MNVYVPRSFEKAEEAEKRAQAGRQSVYTTGILCGGLALAILAMGLQLEQHRKCSGLTHFDKTQFDRLYHGHIN